MVTSALLLKNNLIHKKQKNKDGHDQFLYALRYGLNIAATMFGKLVPLFSTDSVYVTSHTVEKRYLFFRRY